MTTCTVDHIKPTGRPASISQEVAKRAVDMLADPCNRGAQHVATLLRDQGIISNVVHKATLIRHARQAAIAADTKLWVRRGKPAKSMGKATKEKRLQFAKANKSRQWGCVMFSDRKKFHFRYPGSKVRRIQWVTGTSDGGSEAVYQPNHPQCVNVYAGITKYGMSNVHVVAGTAKHTTPYTNKKGQPAKNITSMEYKDVLHVTLLPDGKRLFSNQGISMWFLQQDNDPTHRCAKAAIPEWNQKMGTSVQLLPNWPPSSPDLNIIENVWAYVQEKVDARGCETFDQFKQAVINEIQAVPKEYIAKLYQSLPKRMANVMENNGGKTKY